MAKKDWMVSESQLDDDQLRVLFATNDKSCVVSGCAGSGKSVLALIKAQRIQKEKGNNYRIIVYTKALCNYMNAGRESLGLNNEFSYHEEWKWKKYLKHYQNGASYMVYERDDDGNKIPYMPSSDYIIVDEIQDFTHDEIEEFIHAAKKNFFFFGDTAQSIYQGLKDTIPVAAISRLLPFGQEPKSFPLYRNYRLPIPVAKIAQVVGVDLEPYDENVYKSPEKAIPRLLEYPSLEDQLKAIKGIIETQSLTDVAILLPHNPEAKQVSAILNQIGLNHEAKYEDKDDWKNRKENLNFSTTNPKVMTYHSAKGLQFEAVFMPNIVPLDDDPARRISEQKAIYVAMTRTYRYLYIMYSGYLPYPFREIPKDLYITTENETVEEYI